MKTNKSGRWVLWALWWAVSHPHPSASLSTSSSSSSSPSVHIFYDSSNNLHRDIKYHPEQPARIDACIRSLRNYKANNNNSKEGIKLIDVSENPTKNNNNNNDDEIWNPFSSSELQRARDILTKIHSEDHIRNLETKCRASRNRRIEEGRDPLGFVGYIDDDTFLTTESYDVCLRATATWIRSVNLALNHFPHLQQHSNTPTTPTTPTESIADDDYEDFSSSSHPKFAMALTRPPGHHATRTLSNGFCLFNFAAAAAMHAIDLGCTTISIFDWDVHYGQGVADIIQHIPNIRYASMHQSPLFPYEGTKRQIHGNHKNILTVPIMGSTNWDMGYRDLFQDVVLPFLCTPSNNEEEKKNGDEDSNERTVWEPDLVIICAGYDSLDSDELAGLCLKAEDFGQMTRMIRQRLDMITTKATTTTPKSATTAEANQQQRQCSPALILGLEGGYQLKDDVVGGNLGDAVVETIKALY